MTGTASLAPEFRQNSPVLGDLVKIEVLIDGKLEAKQWKIRGDKAWITSGSLTLDANHITALPSEGDTTKLSLNGLVVEPGMLKVMPFTLVADGGDAANQEQEVGVADLGVTVAAPQKEQKELPWILPPVPFGGWNYYLIGGIALVILLVVGFLVRKALLRFTRKFTRKLTYQEEAMASLAELQRFSRTKQGIKGPEWKRFSFSLASTLRRYSDQNYGISSLDLTDREFIARLREKPEAQSRVPALAKILETIDAVRYGQRELDSAVVPELLGEAEKFVKESYIAPAEDKKKKGAKA